jgi:hypothetical protein
MGLDVLEREEPAGFAARLNEDVRPALHDSRRKFTEWCTFVLRDMLKVNEPTFNDMALLRLFPLPSLHWPLSSYFSFKVQFKVTSMQS